MRSGLGTFKNKKFDNLILMDGDGEDRPEEIKSLIEKVKENPSLSVVAKKLNDQRALFQFLYQLHKLITFVFTGQNINFENYSLLTKVMWKNFIQKQVCGVVFLEVLKKI